MKNYFILIIYLALMLFTAENIKCQELLKQVNTLQNLQQQFIDLRFGMFIHFNIPTFMNQDWPDPEASPGIFNPVKLDCNQWAKAATSANMSYGYLTTKHHSGFCIWKTKTTDYSVMQSPYKRDIVNEFTTAFRAAGLQVMLYYSILDTHHKLGPNTIRTFNIKMIKEQLTELLTNYGKFNALIIDGWDAPWSRISHTGIPFEEIYKMVKSLQPQCLLMDLNGAKYPAEGMFYTDIKTYEMGAGQRVSKESNLMPALACLPINNNWFWKNSFPQTPVKDIVKLVNETLIPLNNANCNFILNVATNTAGLIDDNALIGLKEIGKIWKNTDSLNKLPTIEPTLKTTNLALKQPANSSWSEDMNIMDFANDDDYNTEWISNYTVKYPWYEIDFKKEVIVNTITLTENKPNIKKYLLVYFKHNGWVPLLTGSIKRRIKIHRFKAIKTTKIKVIIEDAVQQVSIAEFGVYNE